MKKFIKNLCLLLPMFLLVSCNPSTSSTSGNSNNDKPSSSETSSQKDDVKKQITYLVLGSTGKYDGKPGNTIDKLFLENTVAYEGKIGEDLPGKDKVTSTTKNVEFVSWIAYENLGKPTIYTKVPEVNETILYAFYKSTVEPTPLPDPDVGPEDPGTNPDKPEVKSDYSIKIGEKNVALQFNKDITNGKEYKAIGVTFAKDDTWTVVSSKNSSFKVNKWLSGDKSAFKAGQMTTVKPGRVDNGLDGKTPGIVDGGDALVVTEGKYDVYVKVYKDWVEVWVQGLAK